MEYEIAVERISFTERVHVCRMYLGLKIKDCYGIFIDSQAKIFLYSLFAEIPIHGHVVPTLNQ